MSPDVAKIVIVVLEACAGHLGPPPPSGPLEIKIAIALLIRPIQPLSSKVS